MTAAERNPRVEVPGDPPAGYDIHIEPGALDRLGDLLGAHGPAHRYALIADSRVARTLGERALTGVTKSGLQAELFSFPAGEWNKTREEWGRLSDRLLASGFGRDSLVVALGGGVTGDLAGFVAATFMRGIPVVQVPTTLLAMFDAAVGGKTGVDTEAGKNLIGAFHHPELVLIDPEVLDSLPRMQRAAGLAEAVKTAAILDVELLDWLADRAAELLDGLTDVTEEAVRRVIGHKAAIVGLDPEEAGRRAILNFGHTVGHGIELLGGYEVLHGEAVAAGMRVEAWLGEGLEVTEPGTANRLAGVLEACALDRPLELERSPEQIWDAMRSDKKGRGGVLCCVLLHRPGQVARAPDGRFTFEIPDDEGRGWLEAALRSGSRE